MEQYNITGMSCAACSARVEKAVSKVEGVTSCSVSLLTNSLGVEGTAEPAAIVKAVEAAGYGAQLRRNSRGDVQQSEKSSGGAKAAGNRSSYQASLAEAEEALKDKESPVLRKRLIVSAVFLLVLMYFSMGHMMWGWPLPPFFDGNHVAMGLVQLLLTVIIMVINQRFFVSGFKSLFHGAPNMDTLVAMGASAAFGYSTFALFAMTAAVVQGDEEQVMYYMDQFYFESAAMILTLITVGKMLEAISKGKTTNALKSLMKLAPKTATIVRDGVETEVPIEDVDCGDLFVVRPGENIPVDGIVREGSSAVNEAALTGESLPVDKLPGDKVSAGTLNQSGHLTCEATRVGEDTTLSQIIQMVSDAAATKAPVAKIADKVSGIFVPTVLVLAGITLVVWLIAGREVGFALARAISVLVISCPCALGLATPVAIMVGNGVGARNGIMFKTANSLEETGKIQIVALDKTGTITSGAPKVTDVIPASDHSEEKLVSYAYLLERQSEHPLAKAVLEYGDQSDIREKGLFSDSSLKQTTKDKEEGRDDGLTDFQALPGNGLQGRYKDKRIYGGSLSFMKDKVMIPKELREKAEQLAAQGKTPIVFAYERLNRDPAAAYPDHAKVSDRDHTELLGMLAVADVIKEDSPQAIRELQNMGIHVVMLTGDNKRTANAIGREAGVDEVIADVLPDGKEAVIRRLKEYGKVAMVGDGINDAPALTRADIGIAIGAGTDIAIDAADVVLMKSSLADVPAAIRLSRRTLTNIHENLFWAFIYNIIGIPLAAGVWIPIFGWTLTPMFGAAAMSLSSFCVVTNALRLNLVKIHDATHDRRRKSAVSRTDADSGLSVVTDPDDSDKDICPTDHDIEDRKQEDNTMTKTMKIEGMMCEHCEARVKKSLEAIDGVASAEVSHKAGTAIVTMDREIADQELKTAVEAQDYMVVEIV